jgi:RNA polymerase sigma-70 factor (family 1)
MQDDQQLLLLLNQGDQKAFEAIYDRYARSLFRYIYNHTRNKEVSEEIVQELFISLWTKRENLSIDSLNAYLYRASKYQLLSYLRSDKVRKKYAAEFVLFLAGRHDNSLEEFINVSDLQVMIESAISKLPERCQMVFRMSRFENASIQEIAERLNISTGTVENYLSQALRHLRASLGDLLFFIFWFGTWR